MSGLPSRIPCLKPGIRSRKTVLGTKVFDEFEILTFFCVLYSRCSVFVLFLNEGNYVYMYVYESSRGDYHVDRWFFNVIKIKDSNIY